MRQLDNLGVKYWKINFKFFLNKYSRDQKLQKKNKIAKKK